MTKIFVISLVCIALALGAVTVYFTLNSDPSTMYAVPQSGSAENLAMSFNSAMQSWYMQNNQSYAGFMSKPENISAVLSSGQNFSDISFFVNSSIKHYVIRTSVRDSDAVYCIDDTLKAVSTMSGGSKVLSNNTNCAGLSLIK